MTPEGQPEASKAPWRLRSTRLLTLLTLLIAACSAPPPAPPESAPLSFDLREEPLRAAACIARNIDRYRSPYSASIRPGTAPAIAQVIVTGSDVVLVAQLFARAEASTAVITTPRAFYDRKTFIAAMLEGC
jgi:hypothetical protein